MVQWTCAAFTARAALSRGRADRREYTGKGGRLIAEYRRVFAGTIAAAVWLAVALTGTTSADAIGRGPIPVCVDIRPGLCPNHIRLESALWLPVAVLGALDFELDLVDPATVRLSREGVGAEVEPAGWNYEDVGTPLVGGLCACHLLRGDGLDDLEFFFSIADIAAALDLWHLAGEIVPLKVTGRMTTGEAFEGVDCALVILGEWGQGTTGKEVGMLAWTEEPGGTSPGGTAAGRAGTDGAGLDTAATAEPGHRFSYYTTVSERVTVAIYDTMGRTVAVLNDMDMAPGIYSAAWNGLDANREKVPPGIYFARVSNSMASDTRKILVAR